MPSLRTCGELLGEALRDHDRQRHQHVGVVAGVAEHQPLVARALLVHRVDRAGAALVPGVDALGDVAGLATDRDHHAARGAVEALVRGVVADLEDPVADLLLDVDVAGRRHLAGDHHQAGRQQGLDGDPAVRVLLEHGVEDRVADLVGDLVRVTLGHRLRREETSRHSCTPVPRSLRCRTRYPASRIAGRRSQSCSLDGHFVPDDVRQDALRATGYVDRGAVCAEDHRLVVGAAEDRSPADVVDDEQVAALAGQLGAGQVEDRPGRVAGLGGEADDHRAGSGPVAC